MSLNTLPGALQSAAVGGKFLLTLEDSTSNASCQYWQFKMLGYFYQHPDLSELITLVDDQYQATMKKDDDGEETKVGELRAKTLSSKKMLAANKRVYGLLSEVLGISLFKLTSTIAPDDGGALWLAIRKKFCSTTAVSKLRVVIKFITLKAEGIDDFFFRYSNVKSKFDLIKIIIKDIMLAVFLKGLERRFDEARATLVMSPKMSLDEAKKQLLAYEDMKKLTTPPLAGKALGVEVPRTAALTAGASHQR